MKFKKDTESFASVGRVWYALTDGGYIKPEQWLEAKDAKKVNDAIAVIQQFIDEAEEKGLLEEI